MSGLLVQSSINFADQNIGFLNNPEANLLKFPNNPKSYQFKYEDFYNEELIFSNSQSVVKKYLHSPSESELAIKFIRIHYCGLHQNAQNSDKLKKFQKEIEIHKKVATCSEIVSFYGFSIFEGHILICMELMDMSLRDFYLWLHDTQIAISEEVLWHIIVSVIKALQVCKGNSVMHRDIKPLNILVNSRGEIKLCDFGVSRILDDSKASTFVGTVAYWPPERFTDGKARYDFRSEIWSLGITILEFILGKLPYVQNAENSDIITLQNLIKEYKFVGDKILEAYSEDLKSFIESFLKPVSERPKLDMLIKMEAYKRHKNYLLSEEYYEFIKRATNSKKLPKQKVYLNTQNITSMSTPYLLTFNAFAISSDVQQEHQLVHPGINVLTDQEENSSLPKWINNISEISKEKLKKIINWADLKAIIEGKCHDKNGKELKYIFIEKDFQEVATKMSQKIENELNDLTMKTLKETIRRLRNNISSREYRRRKREKEKTESAPKNVPAETKTQYPKISQVSKSQGPGTNFWSHHSVSGSGLEESHTQADKKIIKNYTIHSKNSHLKQRQKTGEKTKLAELLDKKKKINEEMTVTGKQIEEIQQQLTNVNISKNYHSKQRQKMEEKKTTLLDKKKKLNEEMTVIGKQIEEIRQQFTNVNISNHRQLYVAEDEPTNTTRNIVSREILGVESIKIVPENEILENNAMEVDDAMVEDNEMEIDHVLY